MKHLKKISIYTLLIISAITLSACVKQPTTSNQPVQQQKKLSVEETALLTSQLTQEKKYGQLWEYVHPDDQQRWANKEEYVDLLNRIYPTPGVTSSYVVKATSTIPLWKDPLTGKEYSNIYAVTVTEKDDKNNDSDYDNKFQLINGQWHFFSSLPSKKDAEDIRNSELQKVSYKDLSKDPAKFIGAKIKYTGKISQIQESNGVGVLLLNVTNNGYGLWSDSLWVNYYYPTNAVEDDTITVYGVITGSTSYQSVAGWQVTIPSITAYAIESGKDSKPSIPIIPSKNTKTSTSGSSNTIEPTPSVVPPIPSPKPMKIEGLSAIRIGGGIWDNWDADIEKDGPFVEVVYLDAQGDIITTDETETLPITATVRVYTTKRVGYDTVKDRLVYSGSYSTKQVILGSIYPRIRIPGESISVDPAVDYKYGIVEVTIITPDQGSFSSASDFIVLYE